MNSPVGAGAETRVRGAAKSLPSRRDVSGKVSTPRLLARIGTERPMPDPRQQLLSRVLTSRQFAHADTLKRILRYLCERSADAGGTPPKEYDIAIQAMGRSESFDPRT